MKYYYTGVTRQREKISGSIEAKDEIEARVRLRAMQIRPDELSQKENKDLKLPEIHLFPPIDLKGMIIFTRQFSSLIDSGVAIVQCLDILSQQERRKAFKKILLKVKEDIESGSGLSEALAKHPHCFAEYFIRIVEAGEISGTLDKSLRRIGVQMEKLAKLRAKVFSAMLYPCITIVVAIVVLIFLLCRVIPEVAKLYGNQDLPELTRMVMNLSEWVQVNFMLIVGALFGSVALFSLLYRLEGFRKVFDRFWLKIPLFGTLTIKSSVAKFTRTMSTLVSCGVPLLNSFDICEKVIDNKAIKSGIRQAAASVAEGKGIAVGLAQAKVFPNMVLHMISIGEVTGRLDELTGKVADIYDDEVDDAVGNLTGLIQPVLIIVIGVIIAFLMLAMYMPIFSMGEKAAGV